VDNEIAAIPGLESRELAAALHQIQKQQIDDFLRKQRLIDAKIQGIGESYTIDLLSAGFNSAMDIDYHKVQRVSGIGPSRARSLDDWRKRKEAHARSRATHQLPQNLEANIRYRFAQKRQQLTAERSQWQTRLQSEADSISGQAAARLNSLRQELMAAHAVAEQRTAAIKQQSAGKISSLAKRQRELAEAPATTGREMDGDIQARTKNLCQQNWRLAKANRELARYSGVTFTAMLKQVFFIN
jgi:DNA-binding helix-hairpin-helix protein with protein kinase domain